MFRQNGISLQTLSLIANCPRFIATSAVLSGPRKQTTPVEDEDTNKATEERLPLKRQSKKKPSGSGKEEVPLVGLLAKQARLDMSLRRRTAYYKGKAARNAGKVAGIESPGKLEMISRSDGLSVALLSRGSQHHTDLKSFLEYAERTKLQPNTTVYKGTLFEYTVAETLKPFGFDLSRTGRANDLGIDLLGRWRLPEEPYEMRVLMQCKVTKPTAASTRELEGAYIGAPIVWQGDNVLALLVSTKPSTKGVIAAVQRSTSPMGVAQVDLDGNLRQLLWNATAEERGLAGLGVTVGYSGREGTEDKTVEQAQVSEPDDHVDQTIVLTWKGKPFNAQTK